MEFRLLGPLEVIGDGEPAVLGGPRQQAVLAALLLRANELVTVDYLASAVWEQRPQSWRSNVRSYLTGVRRLLPAERLTGSAAGYRLTVRPGELDSATFADLADRAGKAHQRGEVEAAATLYRQALSLWRGTPCAGLPPSRVFDSAVTSLTELWLRTVEGQVDVRLRLGDHDAVVGELRILVTDHPFRERLTEQLMHAFYHSGRQSEALDLYRGTRARMIDELGLEPSPRLRDLQQRILAGKPARSVVIAQLPAAVSGFTGRAEQLDRLDRLLDRIAETAVVVAISGMAGVGKTGLAVHWAHRVAGRFPDGQLFLDLGGYGADRPVDPSEALSRLLRTLDVPAERIPTTVDEQAAMFRSRLAGRSMLIVLDNARTAAQVRPLLPGRPDCLTLITSRDKLTGLAALDGAHPIMLDPLTPDESQALLGRVIDDGRVRAEPAAVTTLAQVCGHLPLALRLAAARLITQPRHTIRAFLADLQRDDRLSALRAPGDPMATVRLAFDHSYQALDERARQLFRRLALAPGPDFTAPVAAALLDTGTTDTAPVLDRLTSAHLVDEHAPGRYRLHDLLREYTSGLVQPDDRPAVHRVLAWYLYAADAATRVLDPHRRRMITLDPGLPNRWRISFLGHDRALGWCESERANLIAAIRLAGDHDLPDLAWQLPVALFSFFELRKYWTDWITTHQAGLSAARQVNNKPAEAWTLNSLGIAYKQCRRLDQAIEHYRQALTIRREIGDLHGLAATLNNLGTAANHSRQPADALEYFEQALAIFYRTGDHWGEGISLSNIGEMYRHLGSFTTAAEYFGQAITIRAATGDQRGLGTDLHNLADTYRALGQLDDAIHYYRRALLIRRTTGDRWGTARTHTNLGLALAETSNPAEARTHWEQALQIFHNLGDPQSAEVEAYLNGTARDSSSEAGVVQP